MNDLTTIWYEHITPLCTCFFFKELHEWYAFPIWMTTSICFFLKYKHATWMIWLLYDMNTLLLYAHASFSGTNMPHEWYAFPIWHDYLFPLSIYLCKSINMLYINDMILLYDMNTFLLYVHCTCFFFRNQHATWMICLSYMTWLPLSSIHMLWLSLLDMDPFHLYVHDSLM